MPIAAPGGMLATEVVKTFGRSCSTRPARRPSRLACVYAAFAAVRSWMTPAMIRSPTVIFR